MKKFIHFLLAFLIPVGIFLFAMYLMDLYPFGDTSIRVIDAISQYPAFFEGLKDGDLFTFKIGLGANFYTIFTTYLASPLSFLYLFFENYQFDIFFLVLVLVKIGLIGLNMNILLNFKKKRNKYSLIFSTIYALSGYVALYYFNYQFLDALYMLPLIMIGIDKLVNDNKNLMYFITLTLMIMFHYYTAYMICIFSVIYFFFLLINSELEKKDKRRRIVKIFITSLFCGLCSSFITIPSIYSLLQGRGAWSSFLDYFSFNKNFLSMFYDFTAGSTYGNDIMYGASPLFMTLFVVILIIYTFFNKKQKNKYKIAFGVVIGSFILSLSFNLLYYGWHVFQQPIFYPGRFVFVYICFFIVVAYNNFLLIDHVSITLKKKIIFLIIFIIFTFLSFVFKINFSTGFVFDKRFILLLIFNILVFIYYLFCLSNKKLFILTLFLIFLEILINSICSFNSLLAHNNYNNLNVDDYNYYLKQISSDIQKLNGDNYIRVDFNDKYLSNSGFIYNYNGISYFSSLYNSNILNFAQNYLIHSEYDLHNTIYSGDLLFDSLLSVKYKLNHENDSLEVNENIYTVNSLGVIIPDNIKLNKMNIADNYNVLLFNDSFKFNKEFLIPKVTLDNMKLSYGQWIIIDGRKDGKVTLEYTILYDSLGEINLNQFGSVVNSNSNIFENYSNMIKLYLNNKEVKDIYLLKSGDKVRLEIDVSKKIGFVDSTIWNMYLIKEDDYKKYIDNLNNNILTNISFNNFGFDSTINVNQNNSLLLLTIPYDEGITVYANGKKQQVEKVFNGVCGVKLDEGKYNINFKYRVKGLFWGIILSVCSLVFFIFLKILEKIYIKRYNYVNNKEEIYK